MSSSTVTIMVRSILRHMQNTLMIMSVLLVMLAFERLQALDDTGTHKASALSSLWPQPPTLTDRRRTKARYRPFASDRAIGSYLDTSYASDSFALSCLDSSAPIQ